MGNYTNKKRPSNYLGLSIIMIIMAGMVYFAVSSPSNTLHENKNKQYDAVMTIDLDANYPDSPDGVLEKYNEIDNFLSGNTVDGFTSGDLRILVEKERLLLHPELLAQNSLDEHIKGYADKIELLKKEDLRIMQVNAETPRFSNDGKMCSIGVKQFWNGYVQPDSRTIDLVYNLKVDEQNRKWKIIGWYVNEQQGE